MILAKKIKVNLGATVKLDPNDPKGFEFLRLDVGYEKDISLKDNEKEAYEEAWNIVEKELTESITELRKKIKETSEK